MNRTQLPAEKRIELVHVNLMRSKQFAAFAGLFMVGKTTVEDCIPTATTNGRDAHYGRRFVDTLTDKELAFLVMHENMHKCYRHLTTWRKLYEENRALSNAACDYVINITLVDLDPDEELIAMPRDKQTGKLMGLLDAKFRGMNAFEVFNILKEELKNRPTRGSGEGEGEGEGDSDSEEPDDDATTGDDNTTVGDQPKTFDDHDWDGAKEMDNKELETLQRDIDQALRQGAIYASKVGASAPLAVGDLLKPKINWRAVLRQFITVSLRDRDSPSWRKAHKRYLWQDIILPSIMGKKLKRLGVCIDTSGSIQGSLLTAFLSELNGVVESVKPDRVDVLYWDTDIRAHETYTKIRAGEIVSRTRPHGGGGTTPDCIPPYVQNKQLEFDAIVVLSDGYMGSSPPAWAGIRAPVLWCILGNTQFKPPCGKVLPITEE